MRTASWVKGLALAMAAVCVSGALVLAEEGRRERPARPAWARRQRDQRPEETARPRAERERPRVERVRPRDERARLDQARPQDRQGDGLGGDFVMRFLREHPRFQRMVRAHAQAQRDILEQLRTLRRETREQLRTAESPEARRRIIAGAKRETSGLLLDLTNQRIAFRKKVLAFMEAHKEELIERAVDRIFSPERRPDREAPAGPRRPTDQRRPTQRRRPAEQRRPQYRRGPSPR